jgi:hypothetical protein
LSRDGEGLAVPSFSPLPLKLKCFERVDCILAVLMEIWLGRRRERTGQAAVILRDIFSKLLASAGLLESAMWWSMW